MNPQGHYRVLMARRQILAGVIMLSLTAGCANKTNPPPTPSALQTYIEAIADGLSNLVGALSGVPGVTADLLAKVQTELDIIRADAAQIASGLTDPDTVRAIATAVGVIADFVTPFFPAAPIIAMALRAALALLPTILSLVGVSFAPKTPPAFTPGQAYLILRGAAATGLRS